MMKRPLATTLQLVMLFGLFILVLVWIGYGLIFSWVYPKMAMPYECDPFDLAPCSSPPPDCNTEEGLCMDTRMCRLCPLINRVALGMIVFDLILLVIVAVGERSVKIK